MENTLQQVYKASELPFKKLHSAVNWLNQFLCDTRRETEQLLDITYSILMALSSAT